MKKNNPVSVESSFIEEDSNIIRTTYDMSTSWFERTSSGGNGSYGDWKKDSSFEIEVKPSTIESVSKKKSITKLNSGTAGRKDSEIISKISDKDTIIYTRAKVDGEEDDSYKNGGKYLFLFVDGIKTSSDKEKNGITYSLSSPIPFVPRSDHNLKTFKKYSDESFEYDYSTTVEGQMVRFKMRCSVDINGHKVTVTINNNITNLTGNDAAYVYGKYPILQSTKYVIDTDDRRILNFTGSGQTLISGLESKQQQIANGNIAKVEVSAKLSYYED